MASRGAHGPVAASSDDAPDGPRQHGSHDRRLLDELTRLAHFIEAAKRDIAALHPDEIRQKHLPSAADELDAIVTATAEATGTILDSAERLQSLGAGGPVASDLVVEQVTRIFEACTFQDITGQRITKVVKTLKEIELKVAELVRAFGDAPAGPRPATPATAGEDASLLNGPQLPRKAPSQSDIDALFEKS